MYTHKNLVSKTQKILRIEWPGFELQFPVFLICKILEKEFKFTESSFSICKKW